MAPSIPVFQASPLGALLLRFRDRGMRSEHLKKTTPADRRGAWLHINPQDTHSVIELSAR
jgi:hypothetical protein